MTELPHPSVRPNVLTSTLVLTAVLAAALVAWAIAVQQMRGMDAGPGTDLGSFAWFVGIWLTMTMAMMLPSAAPATLMFSRLVAPCRPPCSSRATCSPGRHSASPPTSSVA